MKKLLVLLTVIAILFSFSIPAFAAETTTDPGKTIESGITSDTVADTSIANSASKDDKILKSDSKSFKGKFAGQLAELKTLRAESSGLWTKIRTANQSIKTAWKSLKEKLKSMEKADAKKMLNDLKTKIEPIRAQVKTLRSDITSLRAQKKTEWTNFRAAVKAKDEAKASTALTNIIDLKKKIIEKQKELLPLKQQILDAIKG